MDCFEIGVVKYLIKSRCIKYLCRSEMPRLNLTIQSTLIHFLPDDGEL